MQAPFFEHHVFFCCNQRPAGEGCCNDHGASRVHAYAKDRVAALGLKGEGAVRSVNRLATGDTFAGFKVVSGSGAGLVTDYILVGADAESTFSDEALGVSFVGRYAVIRLDAAGRCLSMYIGEGRALRCGGNRCGRRSSGQKRRGSS